MRVFNVEFNNIVEIEYTFSDADTNCKREHLFELFGNPSGIKLNVFYASDSIGLSIPLKFSM